MKQFKIDFNHPTSLSDIAKLIFDVDNPNQIRIENYSPREGAVVNVLPNAEIGSCKFVTLMAYNVKESNPDFKPIVFMGQSIAKYSMQQKKIQVAITESSLMMEGNESVLIDELINHIVNLELNGMSQDEFMAKRAQERKERNAVEIVKMIERARIDEFGQKKEQLRRLKPQIDDARINLHNLYETEKQLEFLVNNWEQEQDAITASIKAKMDAIFNMPQINYVDFNSENGDIVIVTNDIVINVDKAQCKAEKVKVEEYEGSWLLGRYKIIGNCKHRTVKFKTLDDYRAGDGGYSVAPHIARDSGPCWGNAGHAFQMAYKNNDYAALTHVALRFLMSVNLADSAGRGLRKWPKLASDGHFYKDGEMIK